MIGYVMLRVKNEGGDAFSQALALMKEKGHTLVGAVHDLTDPATGKEYLCFPVERLSFRQ